MKFLFALFLATLTPAISAKSIHNISFISADGGIIHADYFYSGSHAVVLAHGAVFNKESWQQLIPILLKNNITVLAINFRGYGQSTVGNRPADKFEDILAAVRFLHNQANISRVSVMGASMGGGAAAKAAISAKPGEISQLILLSPMPVKEPEKLQGDILYIASENEALVNSIISQYQRTPKPKQLKLLPGKAHAQHIFKTSENKNLIYLIIHFLTRTL